MPTVFTKGLPNGKWDEGFLYLLQPSVRVQSHRNIVFVVLCLLMAANTVS